MNEQDYISKLEAETGLSMDKGDFGFIMGRSTPYTKHEGFHSANREPGYIIWKRTIKEDGSTAYREIKTPGMDFEQTKAFLMYNDKELYTYLRTQGFAIIGEYDDIEGLSNNQYGTVNTGTEDKANEGIQ